MVARKVSRVAKTAIDVINAKTAIVAKAAIVVKAAIVDKATIVIKAAIDAIDAKAASATLATI